MAGRPRRVPRKAVHSRRPRGLGFGGRGSVEKPAHGAAEEAEVGPPGGATMLVPVAVVKGGQEVGEGGEHGGEVCRLHAWGMLGGDVEAALTGFVRAGGRRRGMCGGCPQRIRCRRAWWRETG